MRGWSQLVTLYLLFLHYSHQPVAVIMDIKIFSVTLRPRECGMCMDVSHANYDPNKEQKK